MLPIQQLEASAFAAAETYANVHRGEGHFSLISTRLYEQARDSILAHMDLSARTHIVLFCTSYRAQQLRELLLPRRLALRFQRRPAPAAGHVRPGRAQRCPARRSPLPDRRWRGENGLA